jgi:hypothetical protein
MACRADRNPAAGGVQAGLHRLDEVRVGGRAVAGVVGPQARQGAASAAEPAMQSTPPATTDDQPLDRPLAQNAAA